MNREHVRAKVKGCLLGGLIGDAMGAPVEGWHYERIEQEKGHVDDFTGAGTDDSAIKLILCEALLKTGGHATMDDFADAFLNNEQFYNLFYIPVKNMFHKLRELDDLPIHAGINNMASSSSAMSISPMGLVNLCDPRTAASEAYEVAGLIHSHATSFCRDGASAVAAAVAEAARPGATPDTIVAAGTRYLHPHSASLMIGLIEAAVALAKQSGDYKTFRRAFYETSLRDIISDSRETIPIVFALLWLTQCEPKAAIEAAANFGRDADTLATMVGAIVGAYRGDAGLPAAWVDKVLHENEAQEQLIENMTDLVLARYAEKQALLAVLAQV